MPSDARSVMLTSRLGTGGAQGSTGTPPPMVHNKPAPSCSNGWPAEPAHAPSGTGPWASKERSIFSSFPLRKAAAWLLLAAIGVFTLSPIELRPDSGLPVSLERFGAFFLLGATFGIAYPKHRAILVLVGIAAAAALEASQTWSFGRHGHLRDFAVKGAGACAGLMLMVAADAGLKRLRQSSRRVP